MSQYQNRKSFSAVPSNLKALRGKRSQAEFSRFLGIPNQVTYHRYENGRVPRAAVLQQIASRIGITVDELLTPISSDRVKDIQLRASVEKSSGSFGDAPLSPRTRTAFAEACGELVNAKSIKAIQEAFQLEKLSEEEIAALFEHVVAVSNRAPIELVKFYVLVRVAITKDLERRWRIHV